MNKKAYFIFTTILFLTYSNLLNAIPLFQKFPELETHYPRKPLIEEFLPIENLSNIQKNMLDNYIDQNPSYSDVFENNYEKMLFKNLLIVKRDDQSDRLLGGNKARKLEFILGDLEKNKQNVIITNGMYGSNHALATAAVGKMLGLKTILILGPQPITENVKKKLLSFHALNAEMIYNSTIVSMGWSILKYGVLSLFNKNYRVIPTGGSSIIGTLGYVNAYIEMFQQFKNRNEKLPESIIIPVGSSGSAAGLLVGACLMGSIHKHKIHGVGVSHSVLSNKNSVIDLANKTLRAIKQFVSNKQQINSCDFNKHFIYNKEYSKSGYGNASKKVLNTMKKVYKLEGIKLDVTYSAKAMDYYLKYVNNYLQINKKLPKSLFWLTYNSFDLNEVISKYKWRDPNKKYKDLKESFWNLFEDKNNE